MRCTQKWGVPLSAPPHLDSDWNTGQGRQESNPQPTVLETAALPIELRPYATLRSQCPALAYRVSRCN